MALIPRAIYVAHNSSVEDVNPDNRSMYFVENVGIEINPVSARALHTPKNVGVEQTGVLSRALYDPLAVTENNGEDNGIEMQLIGIDLITVEKILRGK
ncbi:MAG: hypothetical protein ABFD29_01840 [Anaerolineaceae bacterium]